MNVVAETEKPDIFINISNADFSVQTAPLQIYVAQDDELPAQDYDFIFTAERDERISLEQNVILHELATGKTFTALPAKEEIKLSAVLGEMEAKHESSAGEKAAADKGASQKKKLTIGMATYDDYDGVYFSVQAIRMYHPEVTEQTEILVIDNNPSGPCAEDLRNLSSSIPGYRYMAVDEIRGTAVRDFVFREAKTEYVMCIDSHVFIEPGAISKLIDYFDDHPDTPDLLQGPLVYDDLKSISTHFEPAWRQGMFGFWSVAERGKKITDEPFDIPMQGLGLAACRKHAWQGYNPHFRGFGGEEGYIHQKFRNAGARTICLPFLRWMHRFSRPMGTQYPNVWEERIRNYLIGFEEVGLDIELLR
ncbi:MAG: glycosyltransferase, partial [Gammaproteobacteria bacterium]|nr:glycosyltransferase [Gammaproteobacteria bacterium]